MLRYSRFAVPFCIAVSIATDGRLSAQSGTFSAEAFARGAGPRETAPAPDRLKAVREEIILRHRPAEEKTDDPVVPPASDVIRAKATKQLAALTAALRDKTRLSEVLLRQMKEGKVNPELDESERFPSEPRQPVLFKTKEIKDEDVAFLSDSIKAAKKELADALAHKRALLPNAEYPLAAPLAVGEIIRFRGTGFKIVQVIDENNALCRASYSNPAAIWVSGFSTAGLSDGGFLDPADSAMQMVGTKSYANGLGAQQTVEHLRRLNPRETSKLMEQVNEAKP
jgi:hypothetical protein